MAAKIYIQGGNLIIEGLYPDKEIINTSALDWSVLNNIYSVRDKIENQSYELGVFGDITNEFDEAFTSDEEIQSFLNKLSNILSPESNISARLKDILGNDILGTVFGDLVVGIRKPTIASQFQYGLITGNPNPAQDDAIITETNGGTVTIVESELLIQSSTNAAGASSIQSNEYIRYLPGFEMWVAFTTVFSTPDAAGDYQQVGLYDSQNGFFLKYDSTGLYFVRRKLGVDYPTAIDIESIFPDKSFSPEKGNIYFIKYGYLGFATIAILAANPGNGYSNVSKIKYAGLETTIHTAQTFLPLRGEVLNSGSTTNKLIKIGSVAAGIVDGGESFPNTRYNGGTFSGSVTAGTTLIAVFRNKTTFNGIPNRIVSRLLNFSGAFEGNKPIQVVFKRNPTITVEGDFNDVSTDSIFEFSINSTINTNSGRFMKSFDIAKSGQVDSRIDYLNLRLRAGEWVSVEIITTAIGDYNISSRWDEQF